MIAWCYPVVFWGVVASVVLKLAQSSVGQRGPRWLPLLGLPLSLIPVGGLPLGRVLHGLTSGFSIPSLAFLMSVPWLAMTGRPLFSKADRLALCVAGTIIGVALYPLALGIGTFDPYPLGWNSAWLNAALALTTIALLWKGNALGVVLLASAAAWQIGLLESTNVWDYLIDPALFLSSVVGLIACAGQSALKRQTRFETTTNPLTVEPPMQRAA